MYDIILINPPSPWLISDRVEVPLGLLYLADYIDRHDFTVKILDLSGAAYENYILPEAKYYGIGFVSPQYIHAISILKRIKKEYPSAPVIAGGIHATSMPDQVLSSGFDCVVRGEGEIEVLNILKHGIQKKITDLHYIKNISPLFPAWDMIDLESYLQDIGVVDYMGDAREINIMASRGCIGNCSYCTKYKGPLRLRKINSILIEIFFLIKKYNVNRFFFVDDNIIINKTWLSELSFALRMEEVPWHCLGRADLLTAEKAGILADGGCLGIDFGIETGSQKLLNVINKNTTIEKQERGIKAAYDAGLKVRAQFMIGLPQETEEDFQENINFIERNNQYITKWGIHIFIPFPSCDIWENPEKYKYQINKKTDFSNYQTIGRPGEWNFIPAEAAEIISARRDHLINLISEKNIFKSNLQAESNG